MSTIQDGDEADKLLRLFNAMDPANAATDPSLPPGYRAGTAREHGVFFSPQDIARDPTLSIPSALFAVPDTGTPESRKLAEQTWCDRALEVEKYQQRLGHHGANAAEPIERDAPVFVTRGD